MLVRKVILNIARPEIDRDSPHHESSPEFLRHVVIADSVLHSNDKLVLGQEPVVLSVLELFTPGQGLGQRFVVEAGPVRVDFDVFAELLHPVVPHAGGVAAGLDVGHGGQPGLHQPVLGLQADQVGGVGDHLQALQVLRGEGKVAVEAEGGGVVEVLDDLLVTEVGVVLQALLVEQRPVLGLLPGQRHVVRLEVRPVEEERFDVRMRSVFPVVGDETLIVPALLEPVIPCEGSPPDHDGKVGISYWASPVTTDHLQSRVITQTIHITANSTCSNSLSRVSSMLSEEKSSTSSSSPISHSNDL